MTDETVEQIVEDTTEVLKAVTDESWIPWATRLIPKVASQVWAEAEARAREDHDRQLQEEVKCLANEKFVMIHMTHGLFSSLSHTYSTLTHISHAYDSSFPHLLHCDSSTPIVLLLYIWLDTPLVTSAWSYSNIPEF